MCIYIQIYIYIYIHTCTCVCTYKCIRTIICIHTFIGLYSEHVELTSLLAIAPRQMLMSEIFLHVEVGDQAFEQPVYCPGRLGTPS